MRMNGIFSKWLLFFTKASCKEAEVKRQEPSRLIARALATVTVNWGVLKRRSANASGDGDYAKCISTFLNQFRRRSQSDVMDWYTAMLREVATMNADNAHASAARMHRRCPSANGRGFDAKCPSAIFVLRSYRRHTNLVRITPAGPVWFMRGWRLMRYINYL